MATDSGSAAVSLADTTRPPTVDLVLEGGGVKGVGLVGAVEELARTHTFARIAGTSAGAVVGAVLAAMQQRDEPIERLQDIARTLDYSGLRDRGRVGRLLGPLGFLADGLSLVFESGAYEGDRLRDWVRGVLAEFDVHTFGDLVLDDPDGDGSIHHRYRLVVVASDVSRHRLAHFPWDYADYGLDPDDQQVCDAVRASASIPYFFEPVQLSGPRGTATLVDGGLLSNYPISVFDRHDERPARWPTIGVRLDSLRADAGQHLSPVHDPVSLGVAVVMTAIEGCQAEHVLAPCNVRRSVEVDTRMVSSLDFNLTDEQRDDLLERGREAAQRWLESWDAEAWMRECRPRV